jgi:hypothetical protein
MIKSFVDKLQRPAVLMLEIDKLEERAFLTLPKQEKPSPRPKDTADSLEQLDAPTIIFLTRHMHCYDDFTQMTSTDQYELETRYWCLLHRMMEEILFEADAIRSYGDAKFLVRRAHLVKEVEEVVRMVEKAK